MLHRRLYRQVILNIIFFTILMIVFFNSWALDSDKYQVMHIVSDTATYNRDQHTIIYEGNVQADQGSSKIDGDKLIVYQNSDDKNKIKQIIIFGEPAHYSSLPEADKPRLFVEALKITYDPNLKTVLLEGHGKVSQDGNIFSGPHIWYDMVNGVVHSLTDKNIKGNERTEMIIQPQESAPKK